MILSARLRDRVPGILVAAGVQAGLFALLLFSLAVVHRLPPEKETTLILPPLPRPVLKPAIVIDGRPRPPLRPSATPPPLVTPLPAPALPEAAPGNSAAILRDLGKGLSDCRPEKYNDLPASDRARCPAAQAKKNDDRDLLATPHVDDEQYWAAEKANRDAPFGLPGAAGGPLGILLTALFNPGAYLDKHSYSYGPPLPPKGGGAPAPDAREHASDVLVQDAVNAVNARKRALYARPAPAAETGAAP